MRPPWRKRPVEAPERRSYTSDILAAVFQNATRTANDAGKTAAVEAAAGYVARALAGAEVSGPPWAVDMLPPHVLSQMGRGLMRRGATVWAIEADMLTEAGYWNFHAGPTADKSGWTCQVTDNGPHGSRTRNLPFDRLVFVPWSNDPAIPWTPSGPMQNASLTAALAGNAEEALSHEAATPVGNVVEIPSDGAGADQYEATKEALKSARGRVWFQEAMRGADRGNDPDSSFKQKHVGPMPAGELVSIGEQAYSRTLAAMGVPPDLFQHGANSQGQREAARRCHLNLIVPLSRIVERELRDKLDGGIRLKHETYFADMAGRAGAFQKLVSGGMDLAQAAAVSGVLIDDG